MRADVYGAGLAGSEAAWQLLNQGVEVHLWEMRPQRQTPAHSGGDFAELVCSNSFGGTALTTSAGVLKAEMDLLGSLTLGVARETSVGAGGALAVDREAFAREVTARLLSRSGLFLHREEVERLDPGRPAVLATGPLTSAALARDLEQRFGPSLSFFDAAAPIVTAESIAWPRVFRQNRWDEGEGEYVNCPLDRETYQAFTRALVAAERHPLHGFERVSYFEGCLPVEVIGERGEDSLRFGPMRPVGLTDPRTGRRPYAVVQLRRENAAGALYNLVGFQTNLRFGEQTRVFRMIPGLEEAEFVRYGVMHQNLFLSSPRLLQPTLEARDLPGIFLAGQMVGVEGYMESAATGILAGRNLGRLLRGLPPGVPPIGSMLGGLVAYITGADPDHFQPMNANFGLLPAPAQPAREKRQRRLQQAEGAVQAFGEFARELAD